MQHLESVDPHKRGKDVQKLLLELGKIGCLAIRNGVMEEKEAFLLFV